MRCCNFQIFTVPTIARMLIAEESALQIVFDALIDHCKKYLKRNHFDYRVPSSYWCIGGKETEGVEGGYVK